MSTNQSIKMIGGVRIGPYQKIYYRNDPGDPFTGSVLYGSGPGIFYITENAEAFDLRKLLNDIMATWPITSQFRVASDSTWAQEVTYGIPLIGCTEFKRNDAGYLEISSRADGATNTQDNSDNVWAILFPDLAASGVYNLVLNDGQPKEYYYTTRPHGFSVYPRRYFAKFLNDQKYRQAQEMGWSRSSNLFVSKLKEHRLELRLVGAMPRELVQNEYHQIQDFMTLAACGMPVLVYPDRTVLTPWARLTNPYGWFRGVLKRETGDFEPTRADGDMYDNWNIEMTFHDIGEP